MTLRHILFLLIFLALFFDGTLLSVPIVFALSVLAYIIFPDSSTVSYLILYGLILDILRINMIGLTPIAMSVTFLSIYLWRQSAEIKDYKFAVGIVFIATYIYAHVSNYTTNLIIYIFLFSFSVLIFNYFRTKRGRFLW